MNFYKFEEIVTTLYTNKVSREKHLDKYPTDYSLLIVQDKYVESLIEINDYLLEQIIGNQYECLMWFLWDWKPGFSVKTNGVEYIINNLHDYLEFKRVTWEE